MENCADCGKIITMLEPTYFVRDPFNGDPSVGKRYHSGCGDPFGQKAVAKRLATLEAENALLKRLRSCAEIPDAEIEAAVNVYLAPKTAGDPGQTWKGLLDQDIIAHQEIGDLVVRMLHAAEVVRFGAIKHE